MLHHPDYFAIFVRLCWIFSVILNRISQLTNAYQRVNCLELTIEHMTGKLVNES